MKRSTSLKMLCLLIAALFINKVFHPDWLRKDYNAVLTWDNTGYYSYLPAIFIYDDLEKMQWVDSIIEKYPVAPYKYMFHPSPTGKTYIMYPAGMAVLYVPFFFLAHLTAAITPYPADGFSVPYQFFITWGAFLYGIAGLILLRKVLLHFYSERVTAWTLIILVLGTNFFIYASQYSAAVHIPNFGVLALVLWANLKWHEKPSYFYSFVLGAGIGLATIVRPTDGLIALVPILWNIQRGSAKWQLVRTHLAKVLVAVLSTFFVGLIQMAYWKKVTGSWLFFSYPGEWFDLTQPRIADVLFTYEKGWLLYSPLMGLALYGVFLLHRHRSALWLPVTVFTVASIYIICSWSNWWYGGGYGHRAFIAAYAVLSIALAFAIDVLFEKKRFWRNSALGLIVLFIGLNLFQTWQYDHYLQGMLNTNKRSYWKAFLATSSNQVDYSLLTPDINDQNVNDLDENSYHLRTLRDLDYRGLGGDSLHGFTIDGDHQFSPGYIEEFRYIAPKDDSWMRVTVRVKPPAEEASLSRVALVVSFESRNERVSYKYFCEPLARGKISGDSILDISLRCSFPKMRFSDDKCKIYLYKVSGEPASVEALGIKVEVADRKQ